MSPLGAHEAEHTGRELSQGTGWIDWIDLLGKKLLKLANVVELKK